MAVTKPGNMQVTHELDQVLDQALKLPAGARAALAGSLLDSLDDSVDEAAEESWHAEIQSRLSQLNTDGLQTMSWQEARRQILAD
ncbi:MAG: addiction module protein [Gemmatimonadetes bacterium]|jgi:putative addiction module component (TIGR02574 family)|nr:addiction module protein [Gemmatimonadota bacterium]MBT4610544.1 addiction module protein [Gemmatimonadota bacterium]MBT5058469.1 addiction module protein [Gemmatimonadota bacterium]MBT5144750.1 addiction module protein [Gemmatimonadota bacterium]MBT5592048.1 addiction module protein [Gemmatimonadota bacterium]